MKVPGSGYVYVDWGPEFHAKHSMKFSDFGTPALMVDITWLGLQHMLNHGGSGYFPERLVRSYLQSRQLFKVSEAPAFTLPAYMVYPTDGEPELLRFALHSIRQVALESSG